MPTSREESLWLVGGSGSRPAAPAGDHPADHRPQTSANVAQQQQPRQQPLYTEELGNRRGSGTRQARRHHNQPSSATRKGPLHQNGKRNQQQISSEEVPQTASNGLLAVGNGTIGCPINREDESSTVSTTANTTANDDDDDDEEATAALFAKFHEDAITQAGVGCFQTLAAVYTGLCVAADTIEFFAIPYILPSAEVELCIADSEKGWLGNITLMGLAIGGMFWGGLGDRIGRKGSLLTAMSIHALFSGVATFMPTYGTLMTTRFCSAIGAGGSLPLAYVYLAECCPHASRGKWIGLLAGAGALGGIYAAFLAWSIVPTTGEMVVLENREHFSAWHRFLMFCCFPAFCAIAGMLFLPESPRYLVEAGRDIEVMMVLQQIYKKNNEQKNTRAHYQLSAIELPNKRPRGLPPPSPENHNTSVLANIAHSIEIFWSSFLEIFTGPHMKVTLILLCIWSAAGFSLYGLMSWCPEYLKFLRSIEYKSHTKRLTGQEYINETFTRRLENVQYRDSRFFNCSFSRVILNHVDFDNCTFKSVEFSNIRSSKTHFTNSTIVNAKFIDTDLSEQAFTRCIRENITKLSLSGSCPTLDLDYNIYIEEVMHSHLAAQLTFFPTAVLAGLALTVLQRPKTIGLSLFLSSIVALCLLLINKNSVAILGFEASFIVVFVIAWTALILLTIEYYPTHLRCTGFGVMAVGVRISSLIGSIVYQMLVSAPVIVPALLTASVLFTASVVSLKLPQTHSVYL
ncbi:hypothetical protein QAD02_017212 [Eretmocerus hayati]|uniref:Uncharacterized protein n=1 Tax=Eretmocerus hayati TaxID=131215 RepID=A0ACC2PDC9_9HYME|nr:hypothetical protein QAD02_017212 [Eretmocerus hayati]